MEKTIKWEMEEVKGREKAQKLLDDGWEPVSVRKGDWVAGGWSWGWLLADEVFWFKKKLTN